MTIKQGTKFKDASRAKLFSKTAVVVVKNMTPEEIKITCQSLRQQDIPLHQPSEHDAEIAQMKILLNKIVGKGILRK